MVHTISPLSHRVADVLPNTKIRSSADLNWSSLLLEEMSATGRSEPFAANTTPDLAVVLCLTGRHYVQFYRDGWMSELPIQPGASSFSTSGGVEFLRWRAHKAERMFRTAHLYLPSGLLTDVVEEYRRIGTPHVRPAFTVSSEIDRVITAVILSLDAAMASGAPDIHAEHMAQALAAHLLWKYGRLPGMDDHRSPGVITDRRLTRVIEFMHAHLADPLSVEALAREAGISRHHFARRFREATGETPVRYLHDLRMARARSLLRGTDMPIGNVAISCGYAPTSFTTAFRRASGVDPRTYRRRNGG